MSPLAEGAGVPLAYEERGHGPVVLLVHGIASDAAALSPLVEALAGSARVIAYDRRGYGGSGAPEPYAGTTVQEQSEDAVALLRALDAAPAVVVGDGFGALVALDLLTRYAPLVRGAVLGNPAAFQFVPEAAEALGRQRTLLEDALWTGGPEAAVEAWLGGRVGPDELARARSAHRAFFADLAGLATWPVTRAQLRAVAVPVAILTHPAAPAHVAAAADALAALIPEARRTVGDDLAGAVAALGGPTGT
jgi:pimeloyl-ACP methyl ester carboxylesterase